jgi:tetratricopeptide (TPR) repeat protein
MLSERQQQQSKSSNNNSTTTTLLKQVATVAVGIGAVVAFTYFAKKLILSSKKEEETVSKEPQQQQQQQQSSSKPKLSSTAEPFIPSSVANKKPTTTTPKSKISTEPISTSELEKKIATRRSEGNTYFTQGKLDQAIECYQQCVDLAEALCDSLPLTKEPSNENKKLEEGARKQGALAMSNAMMCFLKQNRSAAVVNLATLFLNTVWGESAEDALTVKVLYRRAKAQSNLLNAPVTENNFSAEEIKTRLDQAIEDLQLAVAKSPGENNKEVETLLKELLAKKEQQQ